MVATHTSDRKKKVTNTYTTNGNSPQKLLINRLIPDIISVIIPPIDPQIAYGFAASNVNLHAHQTISLKNIVTDAAHRGARVFQYYTVVNWKNTDRTIPQYVNTSGSPPRSTNPVWICAGPSAYPTLMGSQEIGSLSGSIGPEEVRNAQPFDTSINGISAKHKDPAPNFSKVICCKLSKNPYPASTRAVG